MKPLLIGMAPASEDRIGKTAFVGTQSGRRLAKHIGLESDHDLPRLFDLTNLVVDRVPTRNEWRTLDVRRKAQEMRPRAERYDHVVLLGVGVGRAFGVPTFPLLTWTLHRESDTRFAICPHPSGLTRWWNDPANCADARTFFRRLAVDSHSRRLSVTS